MKTLAKQIGIILILVLTVLSVDAQKEHNEYKMFETTYFIGDVSSDFNENDEVTIKGLNGEELLVSTLRLSWIFSESLDGKDYIIFQMQTLDSKKLGKEDWYEEIVEIYWMKIDYFSPLLGKNTSDVFAKRKNGGNFIFTYKIGDKRNYLYLFNEQEEEEFVIGYYEE